MDVLGQRPRVVCAHPRRIHARHAKVSDDGAHPVGARHQHDVGALEVGVNDSGAVRGMQPIGQLCRHLKRLGPRQRSAPDSGQQRLAFEQLHREEEQRRPLDLGLVPVRAESRRHLRMHADFVDAADVGMGDFAGKVDLVFEPLDERGVPGEVGAQRLERHLLLDDQVVGLVHLAHAAAPDQPRNEVSPAHDVAGGER